MLVLKHPEAPLKAKGWIYIFNREKEMICWYGQDATLRGWGNMITVASRGSPNAKEGKVAG